MAAHVRRIADAEHARERAVVALLNLALIFAVVVGLALSVAAWKWALG